MARVRFGPRRRPGIKPRPSKPKGKPTGGDSTESAKEIAHRLTMSPHTLNNHLRHIFEKLQVRGRVELAIYGTKRNL